MKFRISDFQGCVCVCVLGGVPFSSAKFMTPRFLG